MAFTITDTYADLFLDEFGEIHFIDDLTYTFMVPSRWEVLGLDWHSRHYRRAVPQSLIYRNGALELVEWPSQDDFNESTHVWRGGFEYVLSSDERDILTAGGYGDYITPVESGV